MKQLIQVLLLSTALLAGKASVAQSTAGRYKIVDDYVKSLGSLDTLNMGTISYIVTKKFNENSEKVRAIFDWIANNISLDVKAVRNGGNDKMTSEEVLKTRKANSNGYAALFQDMCSVVKIRCLTVDGFIKKNTEQINDVPDEFNHTWNVVQLGQSPETWYYVDPALGTGYTDEKITVFTKAFNDYYFFADKTIFNSQHFPDNQAWQLGGNGAKSAKDFFALPIVRDYAYEFGVSNFIPQTGAIKATTKKPVQFSFKASSNNKIDIVSLQLGTEKKRRVKTVDYSFNGGSISFSYKFDEEESYPVTVMINNKPVLGYFVEIAE
jgi:transglutaminase/protease-like cytokinesis protein 3